MSAPPNTPTRSDAELARARAVLARIVAECVSEPDADWLVRLRGEDVRVEVESALAALDADTRLASAAFERLKSLDAVIAERNDLLGHTVRSACPPYELEYGASDVFQQSASLADIAGFYEAFGVRVGGPLTERPDHFVPEWEFLSLLARQESDAAGAGRIDDAVCCRDAQRQFLKDHAATWMFAWFSRVRRARPDGFFAAISDLAEAVLREWCEARSVTHGAAWLELRPVSEDDSSISCGADGGQVELGPRLAAACRREGAGC